MTRLRGGAGLLVLVLAGCARFPFLPSEERSFDPRDSVAFVAGVRGRVATFSGLCKSATWPIEIEDYRVGSLEDPFLAQPECYRRRLDTLALHGRCAEAGLELVVVGGECSASVASHPCCDEIRRRPERIFRAWSGDAAAADSLRREADPVELRWWDPRARSEWFQRAWDSALLEGRGRLPPSPPVPFPDDSASIAIDFAFTKLLNVTRSGLHLAFTPGTPREEFYCRVLDRGLTERGVPWRACRDRIELDSISKARSRRTNKPDR